MRARRRRDLADHDLGRGTGDRRQIVMLRHPIAGVAEPFGMRREIEAVAQRRGAGRAGGHRREVEDGEGRHGGTLNDPLPLWERVASCER